MTAKFAALWPAGLDALYDTFGWEGVVTRNSVSQTVVLRGAREQESGDAGYGAGQLVRGAIKLRTLSAHLAAGPLFTIAKGDIVTWEDVSYKVTSAPLKLGPRMFEYEFDLAPIGVSVAGGV
jgi:hypothetical protein